MKKTGDRKIGQRILAGFLMVAIVATIVGGTGILGLSMINQRYRKSYSDSVAALKYIERISSNFQRTRINLYGVVMGTAPEEKTFFKNRIAALNETVDENLAAYKELVQADNSESAQGQRELLQKLEDDLTVYTKESDAFLSGVAMDVERRTEAYNALKDQGALRRLALVADDVIAEIVEYNLIVVEKSEQTNDNFALFFIGLMLAGVAVSFGVSVFIGVRISRSISKPIGKLVRSAELLALGDVEIQVNAETQDEIGELMEAFSRMIASVRNQAKVAQSIAEGDLTMNVEIRSEQDLLGKKLQEMVDRNNGVFAAIRAAADQVSAGAVQLSDASQHLAQGSGEQASSIQQVGASITELAELTQQNAANAMQAQQMVDEANNQAKVGNTSMLEMTQAMENINQASDNISKVIQVIDNIAFQTNILALNAAVEAARAGTAGKGFAVVADEVRNLAAKSAEAAKETTAMIEDTIAKVRAGTALVDETAQSLSRIAEHTERSAKLVEEIALESEHQSVSIGQINTAVSQVAQITQTNSAAAEETASVSEELTAQAEELKAVVAQVKLRSTETNSSPDFECSPKADIDSPQLVKY